NLIDTRILHDVGLATAGGLVLAGPCGMTSDPVSPLQTNWQLSITELGHLSSELVFAHETALVMPIRSKRYQAPGQSAFLIYKGELHVETDAGRVVVGP